VSDWCANRQKCKRLTVTGLVVEVDGRIRSARAIEDLARLVSARFELTSKRPDDKC
jgi:hypothetical protein